MASFYSEFFHSLPNVGDGLAVTVEVTLLGAAVALALAFVLGLAAGARWMVVRGVSRVFVEFFRGTSLFVQLFWLFFALPVLGYQIQPIACAVVAFGLNYGAYGSEVVRGAIAAVPVAQREAAVALDLSPFQRMRLVVLPQAWPQMIPPFNNLLIQLLKCTPLVSLITVSDITFRLQQMRSATGDTKDAYLTLLVIYFVIAYAFTLLMNAAERAAKARLGQYSDRRIRSLRRKSAASAASTAALVSEQRGGTL